MTRPLWQRLHDRFDPQQPAQDQAWRVEREGSPAGVICETLDLPFGVPRAMLTGTVGTGKTTELLRIAELRKDKELVIFLRLDRHFLETVGDPAGLQTVSPWEVCFLAGLATLRAAESIGFDLPEVHLRSTLIHIGPPADGKLLREAYARGVELKTFSEYQGLLDFTRYLAWQTNALEADPIYPPWLYVEQPARLSLAGGREEQSTERALTRRASSTSCPAA